MTVSSQMCLVFRLGGIGFAVPVDLVEEVCAEGDVLEGQEENELVYRGVRIPHFDFNAHLGLSTAVPDPAGAVVILKGAEVPLAMLVDKVEGVFPQDLFEFQPVPPMLTLAASLPYRQLALWREQPLVFFDRTCLAALAEGL